MAVTAQLEAVLRRREAFSQQRPATLEELRVSFEQRMSEFPGEPDVRYAPVDAGGVPAEWIVAPGAVEQRVLLFLHGGAYVLGSVKTHRDLIGRLSRAAGVRALGLDYQLAPEHPFPAAVEDSTAAYRWLVANGTDPASIVVAGDSAGGGLVMATLLALRDAVDPLPAAGVCLSPWIDLVAQEGEESGSLQTSAKRHLGGHDPRTPLASPLYADLRGLPLLLIHAGGSEDLLDDSTRLAERTRAAGVDTSLEVWDDMVHVWHLWAPILPEGQQAIERIGEFVRSCLG